MAKVVFICVAEYDGPVAINSGLDDDADSYMYEFFGDVTGNYDASINGAVVAAPENMTLEKAKQIITGTSD